MRSGEGPERPRSSRFLTVSTGGPRCRALRGLRGPRRGGEICAVVRGRH